MHADVTSQCCKCLLFWIRSSLQRQTAQPFRTIRAAPAAPRSRRHLQCRAGNLLLELLGSGVGAAAVTAVTTFTSENRDAEIERLQVLSMLVLLMLSDALLVHKASLNQQEWARVVCLVHRECVGHWFQQQFAST